MRDDRTTNHTIKTNHTRIEWIVSDWILTSLITGLFIYYRFSTQLQQSSQENDGNPFSMAAYQQIDSAHFHYQSLLTLPPLLLYGLGQQIPSFVLSILTMPAFFQYHATYAQTTPNNPTLSMMPSASTKLLTDTTELLTPTTVQNQESLSHLSSISSNSLSQSSYPTNVTLGSAIGAVALATLLTGIGIYAYRQKRHVQKNISKSNQNHTSLTDSRTSTLSENVYATTHHHSNHDIPTTLNAGSTPSQLASVNFRSSEYTSFAMRNDEQLPEMHSVRYPSSNEYGTAPMSPSPNADYNMHCTAPSTESLCCK